MLQTNAPAQKSPTREELVARAAEVVPLLRARARWIDEHRRLPEDVIEALDDSGLFKMRVPSQYGGYESDARTLVDVHGELAKGDGSAAFCVSVYSLINWVASRFPDEVQDEVFATPNARVCGTIAATGTATPTQGGYIYNGRWRFNSGVLHSHWKFTAAMLDSGPAAEREPYTALVPVSDFEIVDDWHTSGLRGTGSVTTVARDVFVPAERVIPTSKLFSDQCQSKVNGQKAIYQVPLLVTSTAATAGQTIGSAKYAIESFLQRMPDRGISYTDYHSQREAPITHLRLGEASLLAEEAETRIHKFADLVAAKTAADEPWSEAERVHSRVQMGRVAQLAKQAVDILSMASGGSSIYSDVPIQRIQRDMHALTIHALTSPDSNIELYGRQLCGLPPNTPYL
jgi:3-hydroxy-9,10-secoandrosta-1,3,5(10)-triene-9,17-dione monooxygenase